MTKSKVNIGNKPSSYYGNEVYVESYVIHTHSEFLVGFVTLHHMSFIPILSSW